MNANVFAMTACALTLSAVSLSVNAGGPIGPINTQTANLTFVTTPGVVHTLTPQPSLSNSLIDQDVLANGAVAVDDISGNIFALRWTPTTGTVGRDATKFVIAGSSIPTNTIRVMFVPGGRMTMSDTGYDGWSTTDKSASRLSYTVVADGSQTVQGDRYVVSLDAAVWAA